MTPRIPTLLVLLPLSACGPAAEAYRADAPDFILDIADLDFGAVPLGHEAELPLALSNDGTASGSVSLALSDGPFSLSRTALDIDAGSTASVTLWFAPVDGDPAEANLSLAFSDGSAADLSLLGQTDPDGDADGHAHEDLGGDDCDDEDPSIHPGATEVWYDDVDQDCAGDSDHDADGDGYEQVPEGRDCDDADGSVHPGAVDTWYDGVDQDCAGDSDYDVDGDGYDAEPWGPDCDDSTTRISPSAAEIWYDGQDFDCDGGSDYDADGDGYDAEPWGLDCDDRDAGVAPETPELADGVDQDCDSLVDEGT
ncbi:MAG: hypothetical protein H6739_03410 [Alphaproteobacteria bacterium]|nr:hypothetical protein [Alphaproteobacteria bacterium]